MQVVGFFMDDNKKYKLSEEYNEANLEKFCQGVVDGTAPVSAIVCVLFTDPKKLNKADTPFQRRRGVASKTFMAGIVACMKSSAASCFRSHTGLP